jgi:cell division protein FtsQ
MRPLVQYRDPAPSRLSYRVQRLLLTPLIRRFLKFGLPFTLVAGCVALVLSDQDRRDALMNNVAEIRRSIEERPEFMVRVMAIDGASEEIAEDIRDIVPVDFPVSSFDLDLPGLRERVEELDAVAEATVRVRAGGVLQIDVAERVPAILWRAETGLELLDESGNRVASAAARADYPDLPLLAGIGANRAVPEALRILAAAEPITPRLRGLLRVGERRWDIVLDRDQRILLPEVAPVTALEHVLALDEARDLLERDVLVVDMRLPRRPTLRLADGAMSELRRVRNVQPGDDLR